MYGLTRLFDSYFHNVLIRNITNTCTCIVTQGYLTLGEIWLYGKLHVNAWNSVKLPHKHVFVFQSETYIYSIVQRWDLDIFIPRVLLVLMIFITFTMCPGSPWGYAFLHVTLNCFQLDFILQKLFLLFFNRANGLSECTIYMY